MRYLEQIWQLIATLLNWLGDLITDNMFIEFIQGTFEGHIEVINFFLKRYDSKSFWIENLAFALPLTVALAVKAYFKINVLSYEVLIAFVVFSVSMLKIYDKQGNKQVDNRWEEEYKEDVQEEEEEEYKEEYKVDVQEEYKVDVQEEEEARISNKELSEEEMSNVAGIKSLFSEVLSKTEEQMVNPDISTINKAIDKDPALSTALKLGKINKAVRDRGNIEEELNPLKDMEQRLNSL